MRQINKITKPLLYIYCWWRHSTKRNSMVLSNWVRVNCACAAGIRNYMYPLYLNSNVLCLTVPFEKESKDNKDFCCESSNPKKSSTINFNFLWQILWKDHLFLNPRIDKVIKINCTDWKKNTSSQIDAAVEINFRRIAISKEMAERVFDELKEVVVSLYIPFFSEIFRWWLILRAL